MATRRRAALPDDARDDPPLDQRKLQRLVGYNCRRAYIPIQALFIERMGELQLRAVDYSVLVLIGANRDVTQKRLSRALAVSAPNLAVLLDKLEKRALIQRTPNPEDGRSQILDLTDEGRALLARAERVVGKLELDATAGLTADERVQLIGLLRKIYRPGEPVAGY
jgi:DNA-binding MarR family transcriptional regulator